MRLERHAEFLQSHLSSAHTECVMLLTLANIPLALFPVGFQWKETLRIHALVSQSQSLQNLQDYPRVTISTQLRLQRFSFHSDVTSPDTGTINEV